MIYAKIRNMVRPHNAPDPFRAVAHPVRRKMLELLRQRPRTVAELAQPFHLRLSTITEHVRALRVAGLITYRQRGALTNIRLFAAACARSSNGSAGSANQPLD